MNGTRRYVAFGHRVASDIPLPGAIDDDDLQPSDIVIRRGPSRMARRASSDLWRDDDMLHFAPPDVAAYVCTAPDTIDVIPCPGACENDLAAFLIATALPGLLWMRGAFMLHAAAAVMPEHRRVLAIVGPSGAGKSTLLADLAARGAFVVADDSACLRLVGDAWEIAGLPGGYFAHHPDPAARPFVAVPSDSSLERGTLGMILVLSRHGGNEPSTFRRRPAMAALSAVLANRHRPAIPALFGDPTRRLEEAIRIAHIPVYDWSRPQGTACLTIDEWRAIAALDREDGHD